MSGANISTFCDHACHLGEGPMAHPGLARVFWFDILEKRMFERSFDGGATRIRDLPLMASAAAVIDDRRLALATETGLHAYDLETGTLSLLHEIEADNPRTRSNDTRVHPSGAMWFGTMGKKAEAGEGSLWWVFRGEVKRIFSNISIINSIAFTEDGTAAWFTDTMERVIRRVPTNPANGLPVGDPEVFYAFGNEPGGPDGSVADRDGCLWNARWGGGCIDVYSPDGQRIASHILPVKQPTCPAFFGAVPERMVVTSAWQGMDNETRAIDPQAGTTFCLDLPVRGRFDPPIALA